MEGWYSVDDEGIHQGDIAVYNLMHCNKMGS